ncbi:MAG TPA: pyridoxal-phosphate dependent enzyme, partial [Anaeromyxobacter sp.]
MRELTAPALEDIRAARERIRGYAVRTPLLKLHAPEFAGRVHLKLENLQPIGSFKIRGAANAMALAPPEALARGVYTASAGNMAQGVAWCARERGIPCHVVAPDHAPATKLAAIERLGARVVPVPFDRWWRVMVEHRYEALDGFFVHPVSDAAVIAGNGTIGLEILEDLPDVDTVLVPYGGGGLGSGIAAAIKATRPGVRVIACEVETAAPFAASLAAGAPR